MMVWSLERSQSSQYHNGQYHRARSSTDIIDCGYDGSNHSTAFSSTFPHGRVREPIRGHKVYCYVFRLGRAPFETNIENIGGKRYFYARTGDILQERDNQDAKLLAAIREKRVIPSCSEHTLAEFAASLVARTKNVRQRVIELLEATSNDIRRTVRQHT
jgi:hypothetical protein